MDCSSRHVNVPFAGAEAFSGQAGGEECAIHAERPPIAVSQSLGATKCAGRAGRDRDSG